MNPKRAIRRHITIKIQKLKDKENLKHSKPEAATVFFGLSDAPGHKMHLGFRGGK